MRALCMFFRQETGEPNSSNSGTACPMAASFQRSRVRLADCKGGSTRLKEQMRMQPQEGSSWPSLVGWRLLGASSESQRSRPASSRYDLLLSETSAVQAAPATLGDQMRPWPKASEEKGNQPRGMVLYYDLCHSTRLWLIKCPCPYRVPIAHVSGSLGSRDLVSFGADE